LPRKRRAKPTKPETEALVVAPRTLSSVADLLKSAGPNSDFSYRVFEDLVLVGANFHRSLFTGAVFRACRFSGVEFSRSDLDGFKAESCTYENCRFVGCDIRSSSFDGCAFTQCTLDEALIKDCTFDRCEFKDTSWQQTVTSECSFDATTLDSCPLTRSSITQNRFSRSRFVDMTLGDCSFLYIIFASCTFERCAINAESVGMIFGITVEELQNFEIWHSGQPLAGPESSQIVSAFLYEYARRGWSLGVSIMRLNFHLTAELYAIHEYLTALESDVENGFLLNREELDFLARVMTELHANDRLPLLAVMDALKVAWRAAARNDTELHGSHNQRSLNSFISSVTLLMQEIVGQIERTGITGRDVADRRAVTAAFVFNHKPAVRLGHLLTRLHDRGAVGAAQSRLLEVRRGSHIEIWSAPVGVLVLFNLMLIALNSSVARLTELQARLIVLRRRKPPRKFMKMASTPPRDSAAVIEPLLKKLFAVAMSMTFLSSPDLKGLTFDNVKTIDVVASKAKRPRPKLLAAKSETPAKSGRKKLPTGAKSSKKAKKRAPK